MPTSPLTEGSIVDAARWFINDPRDTALDRHLGAAGVWCILGAQQEERERFTRLIDAQLLKAPSADVERVLLELKETVQAMPFVKVVSRS